MRTLITGVFTTPGSGVVLSRLPQETPSPPLFGHDLRSDETLVLPSIITIVVVNVNGSGTSHGPGDGSTKEK